MRKSKEAKKDVLSIGIDINLGALDTFEGQHEVSDLTEHPDIY